MYKRSNRLVGVVQTYIYPSEGYFREAEDEFNITRHVGQKSS